RLSRAPAGVTLAGQALVVGELVRYIIARTDLGKIKMTRLLFALLLCLGAPLRAQDVAGEVDYYVMALSWSPNWCAPQVDARGSPQCDGSTDFGWVLHGLWAQHEDGWPQDCRTVERDPSRSETAA